MKKTIISLCFILFTSSIGFAQNYSDELNLIQDIFGVEKQKLVLNIVNPNETSASSFWSIYNDYETKRKELGKERVVLLQRYVDLSENKSVDETKNLVKDVKCLRKKTDKLIYKYFKKIKKVNVTDAAKFYQLESYIADKAHVEILESIALFKVFE